MKTVLPYKILVVLFLLPTLIFATPTHDNWKGKHTKEKTIKKEFNVNADATLHIDNSYGNIDVITWNENRIVFEITITTSGNDEEKVQKRLDEINVDFEASSNLVSAKTRFNKAKSNSWWKWNKSNKVNMKINYIIKMPITNNVDLNNDYGAINLDKLEGRAKINCDYGKITTKELMADDNTIKFDYTNNSYFEYIKSGIIKADYSTFTVAKTNNLNVNADYTQSKIEIAEDVTYNCDYGSVSIDKVNNVTGNGDYLTTVIDDVYGDLSLNADYGSIKVSNLTKDAGNVTIKSDYVGIKIGYNPDYNFNFDIDLEYASLRNHDGFEFTKKHVESGSKTYKGHHGNSSSENIIKITSDYGSVSFNKN